MRKIVHIVTIYMPMLVGIVVGFINQKLYALHTGPTHFAQIGDFTNYFQLISLVASAGIGLGVTKLVAQNTANKNAQAQIASNGFFITLLASISACLLLFVLYLSNAIHISNQLFYIFLACIVPLGLVQFGFSLLNGHSLTNTYNIFQFLLHGINLSITYLLVTHYGLHGALISICIPLALTAVLLIPYLLYTKKITFEPKSINMATCKTLLHYTILSAVVVFLLPISFILIRNQLDATYSGTLTGYWQSCMNMSRFLIAFITAVMPVYFVPKISATMSEQVIRHELKTILLLFSTMLGIYLFSLIFFGDFVLTTLFTKDFVPAKQYLLLTAIGDSIRVLAIPFAYILISQSKLKKYILFETGFYIALTVLSIVAAMYNLHLVFYAYIFTCCLYLGVLLIDYFNHSKSNHENFAVR